MSTEQEQSQHDPKECHLTLHELQLQAVVQSADIEPDLKAAVLQAIHSICPLRKVALQRFEMMKEMSSELQRLKK